MKDHSYHTSIEVPLPPNVVFAHIKDISEWWPADFEGQCTNLNDEFIVRHGDVHYSKQKLTDIIPDEKLVWLVTDCKLNWIEKNKAEWTNTRMVFKITAKGAITTVNFRHEGLVPELECYSRVAESWELVIKENLYNLLMNGGGKGTI